MVYNSLSCILPDLQKFLYYFHKLVSAGKLVSCILPNNPHVLTLIKKQDFKIIVGEGESAGFSSIFFFSHNVFLPFNLMARTTFNLTSADAFILG